MCYGPFNVRVSLVNGKIWEAPVPQNFQINKRVHLGNCWAMKMERIYKRKMSSSPIIIVPVRDSIECRVSGGGGVTFSFIPEIILIIPGRHRACISIQLLPSKYTRVAQWSCRYHSEYHKNSGKRQCTVYIVQCPPQSQRLCYAVYQF
jgi:hypothetical protein